MSDQEAPSSHVLGGESTYDVAGPADGFPLVFLHAGGMTRKMWQPQIEAFADKYRVMVPDLPGHGTQARTPFHLHEAAREVANMISWEAEGPAIVVGLELGGYVAMTLVQQYPEHANGMALVNCSFRNRGLRGLGRKVHGLLLTYSPPPIRASLAGATAKGLRTTLPKEVAQSQLDAGLFWKGEGQGQWELGGKTLARKLNKYKGSVLILNGEKDKSSRKGELDLLADLTEANARIETLEKAGYFCNLEKPEEFNKALSGFLESVFVW